MHESVVGPPSLVCPLSCIVFYTTCYSLPAGGNESDRVLYEWEVWAPQDGKHVGACNTPNGNVQVFLPRVVFFYHEVITGTSAMEDDVFAPVYLLVCLLARSCKAVYGIGQHFVITFVPRTFWRRSTFRPPLKSFCQSQLSTEEFQLWLFVSFFSFLVWWSYALY